eukprot:3940503-Rhodomonas_salina.1
MVLHAEEEYLADGEGGGDGGADVLVDVLDELLDLAQLERRDLLNLPRSHVRRNEEEEQGSGMKQETRGRGTLSPERGA